jgi:DNA-binding MarR family transcriptional regulator
MVPAPPNAASPPDPGSGGDAPALVDLIELLFFAYRDFVGDADRLLESYGFGRAHHRVLHFVHRLPGMTIAELLEILKITKQSLNRVMKDLLDAGFIEIRSGAVDRRQRNVFVSEAGRRLAVDLTEVQSARLARALERVEGDAHMQVAAFLLGMIDPAARGPVQTLLSGSRLRPHGDGGAA